MSLGIKNNLTERDLQRLLSALDETALVSMTDEKGNILYANQKFIEVSKYSLTELLGQNHRILKSHQQPDELFVDLWKTISNGKIWRGEIKNRAKDGTYYWVDTSIAPILGADGKPERYISVRFLITGKKKAEEALQLFMDSANDAILTKDLNGKILSWNKSAERIYGYTEKEMIGKNIATLAPVDRKDEMKDVLQKIQGGQKISHFETKRIRKDGKIIDVALTISPLKGLEGNVIGVSTIAQDITERKEKEKTLSGLLTALDETALVSMTDEKGNILYANQKFIEVSKYSLTELLGQNHRILKSHQQPDELFVDLWKTISNGKIWRGEIKNRAKDGTYYWVDTSIAPILGADGKPERYISVRFLITGRKKQEENEKKENRQIRNKFISIVSHQFRTPLTSINWNLETILKGSFGKLESTQEKFLRATHEASLEITRRIGNLLTAMDIEEKRLTFDKEEVVIDNICWEVTQQLASKAHLKDISYTYTSLDKNLPDISADAEKLSRVIREFVDNAIAYTKPGGMVIASLKRKDDFAHFEVKDNGIGIPEDEQHRVFTRFFRASNAVTMYTEGFGLGLYIAKNFIEQQGGKIGFTSHLGEGSTFWFELPFAS